MFTSFFVLLSPLLLKIKRNISACRDCAKKKRRARIGESLAGFRPRSSGQSVLKNAYRRREFMILLRASRARRPITRRCTGRKSEKEKARGRGEKKKEEERRGKKGDKGSRSRDVEKSFEYNFAAAWLFTKKHLNGTRRSGRDDKRRELTS